ncbi:MFS transporter [Micromonospora sp. CPCC 205561]|uniref:MFS transporter n=1 Tax=Micromonospora sp. CPCC 205561 TaxID=3122407 RepID=UPI002FF36F25
MSAPVTPPADASPSAWAPLRLAAFRSLWLAVLASNVGTWMQTVGAQWLLVGEANASTLVALVQTASMLCSTPPCWWCSPWRRAPCRSPWPWCRPAWPG